MTWIDAIIALVAGLGGAAIAWLALRRRVTALQARLWQVSSEAQQTQKQAAALRTRLDALVTLGEAAHSGLLLADSSRVVIHVNAAARALFMAGREETLDASSSLIAVTQNHQLDDLASQAQARRETLEQQIVVRGRPYRVRALPVPNQRGMMVALALEDVGELQTLGRARRDMVANISHDLRTPITSIRLLLDTLRRARPPDAAQRRAMLDKMAAETDALRQLAEELLDLAMIESGRAEIALKPTSLRAITGAAVERLAEQVARKKVAIDDQTPAELMALADAEQVTRALVNLLHNAIKFSPAQSAVTISAQADGDWVKIAVTDSGPGIRREDRERVFERFYRADHSRSGGGTGLGLAIAKHIVLAHGGAIRAEESPAPPGARVSFTLPRVGA